MQQLIVDVIIGGIKIIDAAVLDKETGVGRVLHAHAQRSSRHILKWTRGVGWNIIKHPLHRTIRGECAGNFPRTAAVQMTAPLGKFWTPRIKRGRWTLRVGQTCGAGAAKVGAAIVHNRARVKRDPIHAAPRAWTAAIRLQALLGANLRNLRRGNAFNILIKDLILALVGGVVASPQGGSGLHHIAQAIHIKSRILHAVK